MTTAAMEKAPPIVYDCLEHTRAALEAAAQTGQPISLLSAPDAAAYLGPRYLLRAAEIAQAEYRQVDCLIVLDCGGAAALAMDALEQGCPAIYVKGDRELRQKLEDIAKKHGARVVGKLPRALDLRTSSDPLADCLAWLKSTG